MKKIKKMLVALCLVTMLFLPNISAMAIDFDINAGSGGWGISIGDDGGGLSNNSHGLPKGSISGIVENILMWLLGILSAVSLIGFIIAGILYLTATGDETQIEKAKKAMLYSIVGVIVGLSGFVIFQAAQYMLGGRSSF